MPPQNENSWINDGEKYALVALSIKLEVGATQGQLSPNLWTVTNTQFGLPTNWKEWLGTIRADEVANANLLLLSKMESKTPDILDGENRLLSHRVGLFYVGLLLSSTFSTAHRPVLINGSCRDGEIGLRQQSDLEIPIPCEFRRHPAVTAQELETAARLAGKIEKIEIAPPNGSAWRFFRVLHLYQETRAAVDILERIHQYARCIDGLILPQAGETKRQFKSRTELFIGPRHHDLMGEIYDVRSAIEHLHENRYLDNRDRDTRLDLMKKEAIAEHIARTSIARIVENPTLWPHFANVSALAAFWSLSDADRKALWGAMIDPMVALADFEPKYINDAALGLP